MDVDVEDMNKEELDVLERKVAARREDLTKKMNTKGMSDLIECLLEEATPADYDHPEVGDWVGTSLIPAGLIALKKDAAGFVAKTHRGDTFVVVIEEITETGNLSMIERENGD